MQILNVTYLIYGIPCFLLYWFVVGTVISMRKALSSSFITIFLLQAVVNLVTYINVWLALRVVAEPAFFWYFEWLRDVQLFRYIQQFLLSYCYFAQNASAFLFTANRFTAICTPSHHHSFWKSWKWPFIVIVHAVSLGIPLATRWPAIVEYVYDPARNLYVQKRTGTIPILNASVAYGAVMLLVCVAANAYSAYGLLKFKMSTKTSRNELYFTLISFGIFLAQVLNTSIVLFTAIFVYSSNMRDLELLTTITPYASDVFSLGPPVYVLMVPGPIRNRMRAVLRRTVIKPTNLTTINTTKSSYGGVAIHPTQIEFK